MSTHQTTTPALGWAEIAIARASALAALAASRGVVFTNRESAGLIALTLRRDADNALAVARKLTGVLPAAWSAGL